MDFLFGHQRLAIQPVCRWSLPSLKRNPEQFVGGFVTAMGFGAGGFHQFRFDWRCLVVP
jgi:hypothetical protein